jgi:hypothetical protein
MTAKGRDGTCKLNYEKLPSVDSAAQKLQAMIEAAEHRKQQRESLILIQDVTFVA